MKIKPFLNLLACLLDEIATILNPKEFNLTKHMVLCDQCKCKLLNKLLTDTHRGYWQIASILASSCKHAAVKRNLANIKKQTLVIHICIKPISNNDSTLLIISQILCNKLLY